jgi:hypothetical protein
MVTCRTSVLYGRLLQWHTADIREGPNTIGNYDAADAAIGTTGRDRWELLLQDHR